MYESPLLYIQHFTRICGKMIFIDVAFPNIIKTIFLTFSLFWDMDNP